MTKNKSTRLLIAGGCGFIGTNLMMHFENFYSVVSIDNTKSISKTSCINLDLTDRAKVDQFSVDCDYFDVLIFLVGLAHSKGKGKDFPEFEKVNYQSLVNLVNGLTKASKVPRKIIFSSTISIYGERYGQNKYFETLEPNPFSPYAVTKLQAEQYLIDNFGEQSWVLRFASVYSPDFSLNIDRRTKMRGMNYKVGNGTKKLSLCNIENIEVAVEGIIAGEVPAGIYNISDPVVYSYNDLLNQQGVAFVFRIPVFAIRLLYILGSITNNIFLIENSTKLITDNIFPSDKIQKYIKLNSTIKDLKMSND